MHRILLFISVKMYVYVGMHNIEALFIFYFFIKV